MLAMRCLHKLTGRQRTLNKRVCIAFLVVLLPPSSFYFRSPLRVVLQPRFVQGAILRAAGLLSCIETFTQWVRMRSRFNTSPHAFNALVKVPVRHHCMDAELVYGFGRVALPAC